MARLRVEKGAAGQLHGRRLLETSQEHVRGMERRGEIVPTVTAEGPRGPRYLYSRADLDRFRIRIDYNV